MTDHKDLIERLRSGQGCQDKCRVMSAASGCICAEAADALEAARDRIESVVAARDMLGRYWEEACAKLEAAQEQCVEVKPLDWEDYMVSSGHRRLAHSACPHVAYRVEQKFFPETFFSVQLADGGFSSAPTFEAAKAAAQADYERRVLASITTRPASAIWAEATAAAYGAAVATCKDWSNQFTKDHTEAQTNYDKLLFGSAVVMSGQIEEDILALTPQSARDWLAEREAAAYRKGQEDMRERAAGVAAKLQQEAQKEIIDNENDFMPNRKAIDLWTGRMICADVLASGIRALPIKEKDDE